VYIVLRRILLQFLAEVLMIQIMKGRSIFLIPSPM